MGPCSFGWHRGESEGLLSRIGRVASSVVLFIVVSYTTNYLFSNVGIEQYFIRFVLKYRPRINKVQKNK